MENFFAIVATVGISVNLQIGPLDVPAAHSIVSLGLRRDRSLMSRLKRFDSLLNVINLPVLLLHEVSDLCSDVGQLGSEEGDLPAGGCRQTGATHDPHKFEHQLRSETLNLILNIYMERTITQL